MPPHVHKVFKTNNVLVDENFISKVADAGIVRLLQRIDDAGPSQISDVSVFQDPDYRTNYFIMIIFCLGMRFLRKPLAIVAAILTGLSIAFLNDLIFVDFERISSFTFQARLDSERFNDFFDSAPIFITSGRRYPIEINYTLAPEEDYIDAGNVGDHIAPLNVYDSSKETNFSAQWCYKSYIQVRSMKHARDIRDQLEGLLERVEIELTSIANDLDAVKKAITVFFFPPLFNEAAEDWHIPNC